MSCGLEKQRGPGNTGAAVPSPFPGRCRSRAGAMPGLQGATLVELPRKLHRTLLTKRELQGRGTDISESVVHTAVMGLLLVSGEVKPPWLGGRPSVLRKPRGGRRGLLPGDGSHPCSFVSPQTHHTLLLGSGHVGLRNLGNTVGACVPTSPAPPVLLSWGVRGTWGPPGLAVAVTKQFPPAGAGVSPGIPQPFGGPCGAPRYGQGCKGMVGDALWPGGSPPGCHLVPPALSVVLHERRAAVPEQHQAAAGLLPAPGLPAGAAPRTPRPPGAHRRWDGSPPQLIPPGLT